MAVDTHTDAYATQHVEHFDVLIVGAGISGIGSAYHMTKQCSDKRFVVLDELESFGGTWRTHTYPGVRSDSDLHTFGYRFKPWTGKPIASGPEILQYLAEVIDENRLARHIRYKHKILSANWSNRQKRWTLEVAKDHGKEVVRFTANFLWMCQGYYRHSDGHTPEWTGLSRYRGSIVHPQTWPKHLDTKGKRVIVIGSGSTAATLVPAIAGDCAHVTMLQRSPTYFLPGRNAIEIAETLRQLQIDERWIHEIVRRKILFDQATFTKRCIDEPEAVKQELLTAARSFLGPDYDIGTHFTPKYRPWQQRIAFIPDGDLFKAIAAGQASVVTDEIESFTEAGILLKSGKEIAGDIIVTATGFNLNPHGDIDYAIDDRSFRFSDTVTYRGLMFTGVPNLAWVLGYFRASWTLRADLAADFVCTLLNHMKTNGADQVTVALRPEDAHMPILPWIDPNDLSSGYLMRGGHLFAKRGDKPEWQHSQNYWSEKDELPATKFDDPAFVYR